jgi:hypothetical protein
MVKLEQDTNRPIRPRSVGWVWKVLLCNLSDQCFVTCWNTPETPHALFGTLVLNGPSPWIHHDTLKYTLGRPGSETPHLPRVFFCRSNLAVLTYFVARISFRTSGSFDETESGAHRRAVVFAFPRDCTYRLAVLLSNLLLTQNTRKKHGSPKTLGEKHGKTC